MAPAAAERFPRSRYMLEKSRQSSVVTQACALSFVLVRPRGGARRAPLSDVDMVWALPSCGEEKFAGRLRESVAAVFEERGSGRQQLVVGGERRQLRALES